MPNSAERVVKLIVLFASVANPVLAPPVIAVLPLKAVFAGASKTIVGFVSYDDPALEMVDPEIFPNPFAVPVAAAEDPPPPLKVIVALAT